MLNDYFHLFRWQIEEIQHESEDVFAHVSISLWTSELMTLLDKDITPLIERIDSLDWWCDACDQRWLPVRKIESAMISTLPGKVLCHAFPADALPHPLLLAYVPVPLPLHEDMVLVQILERQRLQHIPDDFKEGELVAKLLETDSVWLNYTVPAKRLAAKIYATLLGEERSADNEEQ